MEIIIRYNLRVSRRASRLMGCCVSRLAVGLAVLGGVLIGLAFVADGWYYALLHFALGAAMAVPLGHEIGKDTPYDVEGGDDHHAMAT